MALYLARYLNVPPARVPGDGGEPLDDLPANADKIRIALLDAFDRQRQVDLAARLVARHLMLGHSVQALIATLARALLRENAVFHASQARDASVRQFCKWGYRCDGSHPHRGRRSRCHSPTGAPSCKQPTSPGGSCAAVSFIRIPQRDGGNLLLLLARALAKPDGSACRRNGLVPSTRHPSQIFKGLGAGLSILAVRPPSHISTGIA
jgi:hypothetical protein